MLRLRTGTMLQRFFKILGCLDMGQAGREGENLTALRVCFSHAYCKADRVEWCITSFVWCWFCSTSGHEFICHHFSSFHTFTHFQFREALRCISTLQSSPALTPSALGDGGIGGGALCASKTCFAASAESVAVNVAFDRIAYAVVWICSISS